MLGLIVFDRLNDVVFSHGDSGFEEHIRNMAARNGLFYPAWSAVLPETWGERADVMLQLFSPFLASQRIMDLQFHNAYSCIECDNGLQMVFSEYLSYQWLCLGRECRPEAKRYISVAVSLAKLLCGPVLTRLRSGDGYLAQHLSAMLDSYCQLQQHNQAYHVEAVERLIIGDQVQNKMVSVLQRVVAALPSGTRTHAFLAVDSTLVSLYSGRQVTELSPAALLHLLLLIDSLKRDSAGPANDPGDLSDPVAGAAGSAAGQTGEQQQQPTAIRQVLCFLHASRSPLSPHLVYVLPLWRGAHLVIVCDVCMTDVSGGLCEAIESIAKSHQAVTSTQRCQIYGHLKHGLNVIFSYGKQLAGFAEVRALVTRLRAQWEQLRSMKLEEVLNGDAEIPPAVEQGLSSLSRSLEAAFQAICHALPGRAAIGAALLLRLQQLAQTELDDYRSFLSARAVSNATVETRAHLSISRYLDNFADLVHFIYVDRSSHLMTAPTPRPTDGSRDGLRTTVWKMIDLANRYLCEGHMSILWRDQQYSYGHFLWFEDSMGNPQKARESPKRLKALYPNLRPGILVRDFFSTLVSVCFPGAVVEDVRCFQLFLIHKGPVHSSRVLEQSQRIAKTVWEVSGTAATPLDLL